MLFSYTYVCSVIWTGQAFCLAVAQPGKNAPPASSEGFLLCWRHLGYHRRVYVGDRGF